MDRFIKSIPSSIERILVGRVVVDPAARIPDDEEITIEVYRKILQAVKELRADSKHVNSGSIVYKVGPENLSVDELESIANGTF